MTLASSAFTSDVPSFGFVPLSFPRDPVAVNEFYEHILLGQILEPLVETDRMGRTIGGVSDHWEFDFLGTTVTFNLRKDIRFSDGRILNAGDVKWTLERHLQSDSQSRNFLRGIAGVEVVSDLKLIIRLKEPNAGILKALSRDQLGIVPKGWHFDSKSSEPIIGAGAYRLIKEKGQWTLRANEQYWDRSSVSIKQWNLVYFADSKYSLPGNVLPDYMPYLSKTLKLALDKNANFKPSDFESTEQLSFSQTSIWWNPHGQHFKNQNIKCGVMDLVEDLVKLAVVKQGLEPATGIIPTGVAGHSNELPNKTDRCLSVASPVKLRAAGRAGIFDFVFQSDEARSLMRKRQIEIEVVGLVPSEMKNLGAQKFDLVMGGWAGGFNDPDGFVPVVTQLLDFDLLEYFGELAGPYMKARAEQDWSRRSQDFQEINQRLFTSRRMVPGWKIPLFTVASNRFKIDEKGFRYTPRLASISFRDTKSK